MITPWLRAVHEGLSATFALPSTTEEAARNQETWTLGKRVAFRFALAYFALYCFPFPLDIVPGSEAAADRVRDSLHSFAVRLAEPVIHVDVAIGTGSGDTASNYVRVLVFLLTASLVTLIWSAWDRRRPRHDVLWTALSVYLRYALAATAFSYGFEKVLGLQFPTPSPGRLTDSFGDASPMGLLWTFIGVSPAYEFFAGAFEVAGGALLLFRRTTTLGALVLIGVLGNVVLLNFCYDVPVKLFSAHLWLMAVVLALPDCRRLANVLFLQKPTSPQPAWDERASKLPWLHRVTKGAVVAALAYTTLAPSLALFYDVQAKGGSLDGVWEVVATESVAPPLPWRRISVTRRNLTVYNKGGLAVRYKITSQNDDSLELSRTEGPNTVDVSLAFELRSENEAVLTEGLEGKGVGARLIKIDTSNSLLLTRGFRWISDAPFNR